MKNFKFILLILVSISTTFGFVKLPKKSKKRIKPTIVNGTTINTPSLLPYQVLISGGDDGGGTIISKKWILTAGHIAVKGSSLQMYAGVINRNNLATGQNRIYKQHRLHPQYTGGQVPTHDISLIEVTQPFNYNGNVEAVKLASANNSALWNLGQLPKNTGFGRTSAGGPLSNELRQVNVQVTAVNNTTNKIRAGGNSGNDACQGDSGGPLINNNIQIGVVTSGGTCGTGGDNMMVSKYLDFITQTIHLLGTPDFICGNTTFENLSKLPDGVSFQWSASPSNLFTVSSGSGLSFTTANNGTNYGIGKIILTVTTPSGTYTHSKDVWVGKPSAITLTTDGTFSINGNNTSICKTYGYCMTGSSNVLLERSSTSPNTTLANNNITPLNRTLSTASNFNYSGWPSSNSFFNISTLSTPSDRTCFGTNNTGSYFLTVNASNSCGTNGRSVIFQVNSCGFRVFPNPAQTTLAIEFENPEMIESIPDLIEIQEEKSQKIVKSKDIKAIKDKEKNNPKAFSKIDFDVKDLPRGVYYVQIIFDGTKQKSKESVRVILTD